MTILPFLHTPSLYNIDGVLTYATLGVGHLDPLGVRLVQGPEPSGTAMLIPTVSDP